MANIALQQPQQSAQIQAATLERVLIGGDLSVLPPEQKVKYMLKVCESVGLNPLTKPFEFIKLNGKEVMYAKRDCTDQLRKVHGVSIKVNDKQRIDDVYIVTAEAKDRTGREDSSTGAVNIAGLKGEALANAFMKAETKAKRRVTLSICGLGMLDETEVETIPGAMAPEVKPRVETGVHPEQPGPNDGSQAERGYRIPFGQWKQRSLEEVYREFGSDRIASYISFLEDAAAKKKQQIMGDAKEFIERAEEFLGAMENDRIGRDECPADGDFK